MMLKYGALIARSQIISSTDAFLAVPSSSRSRSAVMTCPVPPACLVLGHSYHVWRTICKDEY